MHKQYRFYIFYFLLAFLAYWQVGLLENVLKWDMVDVHYPVRYFISESIINGEFPLWNPYQNFGYPIHADMRSIWTPEIWLMSLFGGYSIYTFSFLFIFYTALSGIGMMYLSNCFVKDDRTAFFTGVVYMLSGYLTAHAQELYTINSFVFIPLVLYQYIKFKDEISFRRSVYFVFFVLIVLTSGYQAHSFILFYLLICLFVFFVIDFIKSKAYQKLKRYVLFHIGFVFSILILLLPIIISAVQVFPMVSRLNSGVSINMLSTFPFSPQSLLSLILPFAVIRNLEFFQTDLSMTNLYFGVITLSLSLVAVFRLRKNKLFVLLFVFGLVSLLASFGTVTPLRRFLYDYLPFMNLFRGSAYFRLFMLIPLVIASGYLAQYIPKNRRALIVTSSVLFFVVLGFVINVIGNINFEKFTFWVSDSPWSKILDRESSVYENIFLQGLFQLLMLGLFLYFLVRNKTSFRTVIILVIIDLVVAVQLNIYSTVVSECSPKKIHRFVSSQPISFPIPDKQTIKEGNGADPSYYPLWLNTSMFSKQVPSDGYNSFVLDKTSCFKDSLTHVLEQVIENKLVYFSSNLQPLSEINKQVCTPSSLYLADSLLHCFASFQNTDVSSNTYQITSFLPSEIIINAKVLEPAFLTLLQTYYQGWEVLVDGEPYDIVESNTMFMSVPLDEGLHTICFQYKNPKLVYAFTFSALLFIVILLSMFVFRYRESSKKQRKFIWVTLVVLLSIAIYQQYAYRQSLNAFSNALGQLIEKDNKTPVLLINTSVMGEHPSLISYDLKSKVNYFDFERLISQFESDTLYLAWDNIYLDDDLPNYVNLWYGNKKVILDDEHSQIWMFSGKYQDTVQLYQQSFEGDCQLPWQVNRSRIVLDSLGNHYLNMDSAIYGCSFSMPLELSQDCSVISYLDCRLEDLGAKAFLVVDVLESGKSILWSASAITDFERDDKTGKIRVLHHFEPSEDMFGKEVQLNISVWNKDNAKLKIDKFVVGVN